MKPLNEFFNRKKEGEKITNFKDLKKGMSVQLDYPKFPLYSSQYSVKDKGTLKSLFDKYDPINIRIELDNGEKVDWKANAFATSNITGETFVFVFDECENIEIF